MTFFTDANRTRAKQIVARYPRPKSAILPLAHLAQDQHAWLSPEAINEIAESWVEEYRSGKRTARTISGSPVRPTSGAGV